MIPVVKAGFILLKRTHITSGKSNYLAVPFTFKKQGRYTGNTTEYNFVEIKDVEAEHVMLNEKYAEAKPTANSIARSLTDTKTKDVKDMTIVEMAMTGMDDEAIQKELARRNPPEKKKRKRGPNKKKTNAQKEAIKKIPIKIELNIDPPKETEKSAIEELES